MSGGVVHDYFLMVLELHCAQYRRKEARITGSMDGDGCHVAGGAAQGSSMRRGSGSTPFLGAIFLPLQTIPERGIV